MSEKGFLPLGNFPGQFFNFYPTGCRDPILGPTYLPGPQNTIKKWGVHLVDLTHTLKRWIGGGFLTNAAADARHIV